LASPSRFCKGMDEVRVEEWQAWLQVTSTGGNLKKGVLVTR
jgi:hypothetical protein